MAFQINLGCQDNEFGDDYLDWSDEENLVCCSSRYVVSSDSDGDADQFFELLKKRKSMKKVPEPPEKDEFEKEVDGELSATLQQLTATFGKHLPSSSSIQTSDNQAQPLELGAKSLEDKKTSKGKRVTIAADVKSPEDESEFYDDIYFDSDDSEDEDLSHRKSSSRKRKNNRRILSNDELFYDPNMDDRDQAWVDKMRRSYQVKSNKRTSGNSSSAKNVQLPESDAVLNCPACLTMLCMDCQKHEIYHNQYRAMFVFNCNINKAEVLKIPKKSQKKKDFFKNKKKMKRLAQASEAGAKACEQDPKDNANPEENKTPIDTLNKIQVSGLELETSAASSGTIENSNNSDELFHPVSCNICKTKVAVYDKDEVYHFFNVVTSY